MRRDITAAAVAWDSAVRVALSVVIFLFAAMADFQAERKVGTALVVVVVASVVMVATAESAAVAVGSVGGSVGGGRYFRCYFYFFDKGGGV